MPSEKKAWPAGSTNQYLPWSERKEKRDPVSAQAAVRQVANNPARSHVDSRRAADFTL